MLKAKITLISLQAKLPRVLHWPLKSIPQQESALKALLLACLASAQKPLLDPESHLPTYPSCESPEQLPMGPVCPRDRRSTLLLDLDSSRVPACGFTETSCSGSLHRLTNPHHWSSHSSWGLLKPSLYIFKDHCPLEPCNEGLLLPQIVTPICLLPSTELCIQQVLNTDTWQCESLLWSPLFPSSLRNPCGCCLEARERKPSTCEGSCRHPVWDTLSLWQIKIKIRSLKNYYNFSFAVS